MAKAYPKKTKPLPTGVKNVKGNVITNQDEKKKIKPLNTSSTE